MEVKNFHFFFYYRNMIWFVDLENGNVYNGQAPYIHYFEKQQSTGLIYTRKICIVSEDEEVNVKIKKNDVFHLIDLKRLSDLVEINDFQYHDVNKLYVNEYISKGYAYEGYFLHMIYVSGSSEDPGEYHEKIKFGKDEVLVGADFYMEYEPHKINLANFGVEIPDSVQKAIYETNVHEESRDNITLNRKWKELLLNYWNIVAAKGSYTSLIDALKWFEYGDLITIREFWKHHEWDMDRYNHNELSPILSENIKNTLSNFSKTTYIGLYLALQGFVKKQGQLIYEPLERNEVVSTIFGDIELKSARVDRDIINNSKDGLIEGDVNQHFQIGNTSVNIERYEDESIPSQLLDGVGSNWKRRHYADYNGFISEKNPLLQNLSTIWGANDLSLKMYLLGNFYETYFMPVHLDLIHSTVETIVYTNTIKILNYPHIDRYNYVGLPKDFYCSVSDKDVYRLGDVHVQVGPHTVYGTQYTNEKEYDDVQVFGVESEVKELKEDNLKTFYSQLYNGVGVVVPFECIIEAEENQFVNFSRITIASKSRIKTHDFPTIFTEHEGKITIKFNLLFVDDEKNRVTLEFRSSDGSTYIKNIYINVVDTNVRGISVYKVKSRTTKKTSLPANNHVFTHIRELSSTPNIVTQYIPSVLDRHSDGVKLNNIVVLDIRDKNLVPLSTDDVPKFIEMCFPSTMWDTYIRSKDLIEHPDIFDDDTSLNDSYDYIVAVSKNFIYSRDQIFDPSVNLALAIRTYCGKVKYETARYCMIRNDVGYIPENHYLKPIEGDKIEDFVVTSSDALCVVPDLKYSLLKEIDGFEWVFINDSTKEEIKLRSFKEPFIASKKEEFLPAGYYSVEFRYRLGDDIQTSRISSAFIVR